ncbi:TetR/AcrR family transcriptional regulator C-terminal ligand-binding domain-containing protein [Microbacterium sp. ZW T5_45]|uniref:TetR/AcrR family transcriptional regulator C-terminal ligand-binding domain-containing protein n=1 Tax=Microbacterium sp. ZW T5_45 TaxID=3378080 RepID=UPI003855175F
MTSPGRPRKASIDEAILDAFADLLVDRGFVDVRIDDVVARAGTNKPAFYRRFRDLADLVSVLLARRHGLDDDIDTGTLPGDLREVQRRQVTLFTDPVVARGLVGWAAHAQSHPDRAEPFIAGYLAPRRAFTHVILARAVARGEIEPGADADWIADLLTGPLLMRITLPGMPPIDQALAAHTVEAALVALGYRRPDSAVADAYDRRADEYTAAAGRLDQMDPRDIAVIARWRDETAGPLVDAGCGPGHWTAFLDDGDRTVAGVDLSEGMIARARAAHPGVAFELGSFRELPRRSASVGGILAWYSLIHIPPAEVPMVLAEFARVLTPGGGLLLGFFDGEPRGGFTHAIAPAWFWSIGTLTALLEDAGFSVVGSERRSREPGEVSIRPHASIAAVRLA